MSIDTTSGVLRGDNAARYRLVVSVATNACSTRGVIVVVDDVYLTSEMIHTASLLHDDVLDHAESRRGKPSVNVRWDARRSTFGGDYILAVGSQLLAAIGNPDVVQILSQVGHLPGRYPVLTCSTVGSWLCPKYRMPMINVHSTALLVVYGIEHTQNIDFSLIRLFVALVFSWHVTCICLKQGCGAVTFWRLRLRLHYN